MQRLNFLKPNRRLVWMLAAITVLACLGFGPRFYRAGTALWKARQAWEAGQASSASAHMAEAARLLPTLPRLWEQAGRYAFQAGEPGTAIDYYLQAKGALSEPGKLELASAYQQVGDLGAAAGLLEDLSLQATPSAEILEKLYELHRQSGSLAAALEDLHKLVALKPADAQLRYRLGLIAATRDPEAALAHLARAAELDPNLGPTVEALRQKISAARLSGDPAYLRVAVGQALASQDEWDLAAEAFYQAAVLRPDYAEAWAFLGEASQHTNPSPAAPRQDPLDCLQKAVELDPLSLSARTFLALYWSRQGRYDQALEELQAAIQLKPDNPALQVEMGNTLALSGDLDAALQAYQRAIELSPGDRASIQSLVDFSVRFEYRLDEIGLPAARGLVASSPNEPADLDRMGQVLIKLNDLANAERFLLRAIQAGSSYAPAHLHLGLLYALRGQPAAAAEELELVISLSPGSAAAEQAQRLLQTYSP